MKTRHLNQSATVSNQHPALLCINFGLFARLYSTSFYCVSFHRPSLFGIQRLISHQLSMTIFGAVKMAMKWSSCQPRQSWYHWTERKLVSYLLYVEAKHKVRLFKRYWEFSVGFTKISMNQYRLPSRVKTKEFPS